MVNNNNTMGRVSEEVDYGRHLLPILVKKAAVKNPNRVAYSFPLTDDPAKGSHDITNRRYANGVNRVAWWVEKSFGKPKAGSFPRIGYIGPSKCLDIYNINHSDEAR